MTILKPLAQLINKVEDSDLRSQLSSALSTASDSLVAQESDSKKTQADLAAAQAALTAKDSEIATAKHEADQAKAAQAALAVREKLATVALATKGGINTTVLSKLLAPEDLAKLEVDGETVKLDGKPLAEYAKANSEWAPFTPALFPQPTNGTTEASTPAKPSEPALPSGGSSESKSHPDPVGAYISQAYQVPKFLVGDK